MNTDIDGTGSPAMAEMDTGGCWQPEAWSKSPLQLQEEARAENIAAFSSAASGAHKHCDAPCNIQRMRNL